MEGQIIKRQTFSATIPFLYRDSIPAG